MNTYIAVVDWKTDRDVGPAVLTAPTLELLHQHTARLIHGIENNTDEYDRFIAGNPLNSDDPAEAKAWLDELRASCHAPVVTVHVVDQAAACQVQEAARIDAVGGTATPSRSRFYEPDELAAEDADTAGLNAVALIDNALFWHLEASGEVAEMIETGTEHYVSDPPDPRDTTSILGSALDVIPKLITALKMYAPADALRRSGDPWDTATPRDLGQALPIALAAVRADIAVGIIPANGSIESWDAVGVHTDYHTYVVEAIFPGHTGMHVRGKPRDRGSTEHSALRGTTVDQSHPGTIPDPGERRGHCAT